MPNTLSCNQLKPRETAKLSYSKTFNEMLLSSMFISGLCSLVYFKPINILCGEIQQLDKLEVLIE